MEAEIKILGKAEPEKQPVLVFRGFVIKYCPLDRAIICEDEECFMIRNIKPDDIIISKNTTKIHLPIPFKGKPYHTEYVCKYIVLQPSGKLFLTNKLPKKLMKNE